MSKKDLPTKQYYSFWKIKVRRYNFWVSLVAVGVLLAGIIPLRLAIARHQAPQPEAILVLGGNKKRFRFAAKFAHSHPELDIWVSDYLSNYEKNWQIFRTEGISQEQVYYDFCPTDTVTNFTCTVEYFSEQKIQHLYLITSDYHMARSRAIATLVFGSRGITITPVSVPSKGYPPESKLRIVRDCIRSLVWIATGYTGASFNRDIKS